MSLVQRDLDSTDCFLGLAQHYGLPTSLVDFTLSPLVAMGFACSNTRAPPVQPRDLTDPMLRDCAVVYIVAAPAFATATGATFEFPPSYSIRLYRQRGLFANFGAHPAGKRLPEDFPENYGAPWCWLQQNAQRVFFPRKYPELEGADELRDHELMKGDEFIIEVVNLIRSGAPHSPDAIHLSPPWVCDSTEKLGEANARFCNAIDSYLRSACLIKMEQDGDIFDPSMLKFLERWIAPELEYFLNMAAFAQEAGMPHPGLSWTADRVRQARACIS